MINRKEFLFAKRNANLTNIRLEVNSDNHFCMVQVIKKNNQLQDVLIDKRVGFVPTMGALHEGHMSLVEESAKRGLFTVVSIFVNPTQFNNKEDFELYPTHLEKDVAMLEKTGCDIIYTPQKDQIYPEDLVMEVYDHEFYPVESVLEGKHRPGHFKGVAQVVHRLFEIVKPQYAFFGEKDYQQLAIIRLLCKKLSLPIEIIGMPTIREKNGLAMSSRNERLSEAQKEKATLLYKSLCYAAESFATKQPQEIKDSIEKHFSSDDEWELEYFEMVNPDTFETIDSNATKHARALVAATLGKVRLIDNMKVTSHEV